MLKHSVGKGRHVMKQLHVCLTVLQYYTTVATEHAGYVLYRALVLLGLDIFRFVILLYSQISIIMGMV